MEVIRLLLTWNFGQIYKEIRKAKGISQKEICTDFLSRSTLSKIENNKLMPSFQTMNFLLTQINMSFDEFNYICNQYEPDTGYTLKQEIKALFTGNTDVKKINDIILKSEEYLTTHEDMFIADFIDILKLSKIMLSKDSIDNSLKEIAQQIWSKFEKSNEWYSFELILLNNILFYFSNETIIELTERIFNRLEKFHSFKDSIIIRCKLLINLSTIHLYNNNLNLCSSILEYAKPIIIESKRYDFLAILWIRFGICSKNKKLVSKGLHLLELIGDSSLQTELQKETSIFFKV